MIIVYHKNNQVESVFDCNTQLTLDYQEKYAVTVLMQLASTFQDRVLVWCQSDQKEYLNAEAVRSSLHLKNRMVSFSPTLYLPPQIGYVEDSPFIKVNTKVTYPTWQMSGLVGAMYGFQLLKFKDVLHKGSLDYTLNSIAKLGMPHGLFCYSDPKLLAKADFSTKQANSFTLFKFVKQHYKARWVFLLALNYMLHEKKIMLLPLLRSLFYRKKKFNNNIGIESSKPTTDEPLPTIDVIIPTIGREHYVYDVFRDLALQTHLPKHVIVVEQNPDTNAKTNLDFIDNDSWPFKVVHHFIHQTGVCNARNLALKEVNSEYVYLADDDNKFGKDLIKNALEYIKYFDLDVISMSYLQQGEVERKQQPLQWPTFGAGCSIMKSKYLERVSFNMALEFGYGEDVDFGMQLRNLGIDIIYVPDIKILHLKASIGGFRSTFKQPWSNDEIQPKPSPTIMLYKISNNTKYQLLGYKTVLLINYYFRQKIKNPIRYYKLFKKQWQQSMFWANQLKKSHT
ncbi:MAG: glycosyltransferase family 2 protein [Bacteroidetes bacterium]|nr:MAG: glycosyltransferase family 2 protein [Bacteroidota bacterium]